METLSSSTFASELHSVTGAALRSVHGPKLRYAVLLCRAESPAGLPLEFSTLDFMKISMWFAHVTHHSCWLANGAFTSKLNRVMKHAHDVTLFEI